MHTPKHQKRESKDPTRSSAHPLSLPVGQVLDISSNTEKHIKQYKYKNNNTDTELSLKSCIHTRNAPFQAVVYTESFASGVNI